MLKPTLSALLLGATLLSTPSLAQGPVAPVAPPTLSTRFEGSDIFALQVASDPQISPDGRTVAYVRRQADIMSDKQKGAIWLVDVATGTQRPLVADAGQPRWSPDGKRLAYVAADPKGKPQLFVRWLADDATVRVTQLPDGPQAITWSPDGRSIAYVMRVPGEPAKLGKAPDKPEGAEWAKPLEVIDRVDYRADGGGYVEPGYDHIFVVAADGGPPRQLSFGDYQDGGPLSWTPDGRSILFSAVRKPDWQHNVFDPEIYALDVATGAIRALTSRAGPDIAPAVSPDGSKVAYLGYDDKRLSYQNTLLYVMNRDGSGARAVTAGFDRSIDRVDWAADGRALYAQYDERGVNRVARITLDGKVTELATGLTGTGLDRPYSGGDFTVSKGGAIAFTSGSPLRPADLSVASGGRTRQLTRLNEDFLSAKSLGQVRELAVTAPDGRAVPAWLVTPPGWREGQRVPLVLEIHGGPHSAYGPHFSTDDQLYAASGYAVLYTNPRGSTSYGEEFALLIHHKYPGDDYGDLMAAVDAAIAAGVADPDNLFVTGGSGGGVLTSWIVGKTDRFKGAAAQKPVINWISEALTMDATLFTSRYWFPKLPWEDPTGYWARSPLSLVGNVKTPTLVVVGSEDYRTPVSEAEQYYAALQIRGVPTALVKVPGASHGGIAARPSQSAAKASAIIAWFDRYRTSKTAAKP
ncbi:MULTISPECIES: S9 family peptidase [unclassified Sphingomonas]|uniref:S9 family peptidase n=1 Tax=unclassified Sphingomonas TaxID=196159 RepID=UPI0006F2D0B8|nr:MULTISPECIES: S9 family peptidase [unclassified Sphingomonas]KQX25474.1 acyl-peptide hydrolase [Sphingomonas sp. Root1294]KQY66466.1 acyl-peptide hydrolase [Sphingomonas sp. Root50]KRB90216.1 acyl-peptide hydrolase [Sphingomonas sp. Root720]